MFLSRFVLCCMAALVVGSASAQDRDLKEEDIIIRVTPPTLILGVGETAQLEAKVVDVGGRPIDATVMFISRARRSLRVSRRGKVTARQPGRFEIVARVVRAGKRGPSITIPVTVPFPKASRIEFRGGPDLVHVGTAVRVAARVMGVDGQPRKDLRAALSSSDSSIATVDAFGFVSGVAKGTCTIRAASNGLTAEHTITVAPNPVSRLTLEASAKEVRTGDVVTFTSQTFSSGGKLVAGVPVQYSLTTAPDDSLGNGATGQITADGRFVAETPGLYTVVARCGTAVARHTLKATKRFAKERKIRVVGRGTVNDVHTSDLWVWEGVDGRDYAVTGTWGANGDAIFWDVTDPSKIERISKITVDARTVNDVKVSADGRLCIISREGASDRKNGIVIIDVVDPRNPKIISTYTDELTGGVHNIFIDGHHVYALSAGRRYDILDIKDPVHPKKVGSYKVFDPGSSIHDVWVEDGIAYSSNWRYGIHMVDVGNGIVGGSPENPKKISNYAYPSGWNHAAFPFKNSETGKFYVVAGDESFPNGLHVKDKPTYPRGWMHFIDFSDLENPKEVARYQVPEAGTHNLWIEDGLMYAAFYNGGLRVVDISGDLMGDLYRQGREISWFLPSDKEGYIPNAPMVWGPQPHKGHIFFSDWNTGLWAVKLDPEVTQ